MARAARIAAALLAAAALACGGERGPGPWIEGEGARWRELAGASGGDVGFEALAPERTGITAGNDVPVELTLENRTLADGSGVAIGDYDGDGLPDVYIVRVAAPSVLYRNLGDWRFEDVTGTTGTALPGRRATGAAFIDVDGDGDLDLLVTALGQPNILLRNERGVFVDVSAEAGFSVARASRSFSLADVDGDGDLDLYVVNNKTRVVRDLFPPEDRTRDRVVVREGGRCEVAPDLAQHWEVRCFGPVTSRLERAEEDEFYLNDGTGRFELVPFTGGRFLDEGGAPLSSAPTDWGLSVRFHDLDGDGARDLYVCNDFETPDRIWMSDGAGGFRAASTDRIRTTSLACMALDFADVDRDGLEDFFTADMAPLGRARRLRTISPMRSDTTAPGAIDVRVQRSRNTLQLARRDGTYYDVAPLAGLAGSEWTWASLFLDVDLDGYEDLLLATGHVWDLLDADTGIRVRAARGTVGWREEQRLYPPMPMRNLAFRNRGDGTFEEFGAAWRFGQEPDISHGMAAGDLDLDGDADLILTRLNAPPLVLRNDARAPRVAVRLAGRAPNTQGIGAVIRVEGGAVPLQVKEVAVARTYLSGSEPTYGFATGAATGVAVEVWWPGGSVSRVESVEPGRLIEIREPEPADVSSYPRRSAASDTSPIFEAVPLGHVHVDPSMNELARQPLLPERLAQLGPGVSSIDLDRDGDPDLIVGAGRGGRLGVFLNEDGELRPAPAAFSPTPFDQTTIVGLPGASEGVSLLIGRTSYEAATREEARGAAGVVRVDAADIARSGTIGETDVIAGALESVGPLALADIDGDGDLDLFVGGRAFPGRYPMAVSSHLYLNEGDSWRLHGGLSALLEGVGVVSAALFTDIDADGDPDLVLAPDWGSIRVYRNDGGRFRDATRQLGLDALTGRWNGLASGDLDSDGLPDLVATSWGLNTGLGATPGRPLVIVHGDLDGNGTYESIRAREDPALGGLAPLEALTRLAPAIPALRGTIASFEDYSTATLDRVLGGAASRLESLSAATLSHTLFLNRGDRFEATPLPRMAQVAPAFYVGVADYDGDGHEDIFLTQNFFATVPGVARYDAGRSLWLAGDGAGGLTPVPGERSGVAVYGDPRGASLADFDADGRIDLVVSQNGAETLLFHNVGATPGLRVRLVGPPGNPDAVGAAVRIVYAGSRGPLREIQAGSGYWSVNGAVQVMGLREVPVAVWVRWPGGTEVEVPVEPGQLEVTVAITTSAGAR